MANVNPFDNQNNVNLSILIEDSVGGSDNGVAASTDGSIWTAARRNHYLCEAYRWIVLEILKRKGLESAADWLPGAIETLTVSSGDALPNNYMATLRFVGAKVFTLDNRSNLSVDQKRYIDNAYAIDGGNIYAYARVAGVLAALVGTGTLYYFKADRLDSSGTEMNVNEQSDITLDIWCHAPCVLYAAGRALLDKATSPVDPDPSLVSKGNAFIASALELVP